MDLNQLMAQAQAMQKQLSEMEEELKAKEYTGTQGGDEGVTAVVNGDLEVQSITIADDLMKEDKEMVQDMVLIAVNDAIAKAKKDREEKLGSAAGGLNIPGL
jgi:DNA-binding YbaB/EbfC family protein